MAKDKAAAFLWPFLGALWTYAADRIGEVAGDAVSIDQAMKAGVAYPMGPLRLCDLIGLDTLGLVADGMYSEYFERRFARPPTLRKMIAAGWYGNKSGIGFYDYSGEAPVENPGLA